MVIAKKQSAVFLVSISDMQKFSVQLFGKCYEIEPLLNGTFCIHKDDMKIGTIYPEPGKLDLEWKTKDELEEGFVAQLGKLIAEHDLEIQFYKLMLTK